MWSKTDPTNSYQNGIWQVGARIYEASDTGISIYPNPAYDFFYVINNRCRSYVSEE